MKKFMKLKCRRGMPAAAVLLAVFLAALTAGCGNHAAVPEETVKEGTASEVTVTEEMVMEETVTEEMVTEAAIVEENAPEENAADETASKAAMPEKAVRNKADQENTDQENTDQENTKLPSDTAVTPDPEKAGNRKPVLKDNGGEEVIPTRQELPAEPAAKEKNEDKLLPDKEEKPVEEALGDEKASVDGEASGDEEALVDRAASGDEGAPGDEEAPVEETPGGGEAAGTGKAAENVQDAEGTAFENSADPDTDVQDSVKIAGLQVEEQTIVIPGLEGTYRYLFLSDTHIITLNGEETQQQLDNALPRRDTLFLDAQGRKPGETFPVWMAYANEQKVDAVLLGGDIIDFPSRSNLDFLEENLGRLEMPVLYVPGNHDWTYPWEYMTEKGKNEYLTALEPFMRGTPAAQVLENEELILLGVDDSSNQIDPAALETVKKALQKGKPVIILQHVPFAAEKLVQEAAQVWKNPVALGMGAAGGIYPNEASQEYMKLVLGNAGPVKAVLAGHIHMRETDVVAENSGIVQYTAAPGYLGQGILLTVTGEAQAAVQESGRQEEAVEAAAG